MLKGLAAANPELAKMMSDPEAMKAQMAQMAELMTSPEGQVRSPATSHHLPMRMQPSW